VSSWTSWGPLHEATQRLATNPDDPANVRAKRDYLWDWALLELLLTSGLRIEEASELTTLDVLKRTLPDGRIYYLLLPRPDRTPWLRPHQISRRRPRRLPHPTLVATPTC
jgi:hypothetical protein